MTSLTKLLCSLVPALDNLLKCILANVNKLIKKLCPLIDQLLSILPGCKIQASQLQLPINSIVKSVGIIVGNLTCVVNSIVKCVTKILGAATAKQLANILKGIVNTAVNLLGCLLSRDGLIANLLGSVLKIIGIGDCFCPVTDLVDGALKGLLSLVGNLLVSLLG